MNIETKRLVLVPVSKAHINDIFIHFNKEIITYMYPTPAKELSETANVVEDFIKQRQENTDYVYAITLKNSNDFLGLVGLHNLRSEHAEIGIWTKLESHGNHYGKEAVGGIIGYAKTLGIKRLIYPVDIRNIPSRKIPLYYHGKLLIEYKKVITPDGRILEEEVYEIKC